MFYVTWLTGDVMPRPHGWWKTNVDLHKSRLIGWLAERNGMAAQLRMNGLCTPVATQSLPADLTPPRFRSTLIWSIEHWTISKTARIVTLPPHSKTWLWWRLKGQRKRKSKNEMTWSRENPDRINFQIHWISVFWVVHMVITFLARTLWMASGNPRIVSDVMRKNDNL